MLVIGMLLSMLFQRTIAATNDQPSVRSETLLRSGASCDGQPYESYPSGRPELTILRISLLPHTQLGWHSHPMPSAAYIVVGELTLERKKDGKNQRLTAGQAVSETVDTFHRGVAGSQPVVLIVFYAGSPIHTSQWASLLLDQLLEGRTNRRPLNFRSELLNHLTIWSGHVAR